MANYRVWIIATLIAVVLIAVAVFFLAPVHPKPSPAPAVTLPEASNQSSSISTTTSGTISIMTAQGTSIQLNDFIHNDPATALDPNNPGYYYLGYTLPAAGQTAAANPPFIIEYISATQYFNIELTQEPIGSARRSAEAYLMQHLGISEAQMCELKYMLSVPDKVNQTYSGENLGFSFCPGATVLP